VNRPKVKAAV